MRISDWSSYVCSSDLRENPQDRRGYCVYLTPAASPMLDRIGEAATVYEASAFAGFSDADLARFEALLDVIAGNIATAPALQAERQKIGRESCRARERPYTAISVRAATLKKKRT